MFNFSLEKRANRNLFGMALRMMDAFLVFLKKFSAYVLAL